MWGMGVFISSTHHPVVSAPQRRSRVCLTPTPRTASGADRVEGSCEQLARYKSGAEVRLFTPQIIRAIVFPYSSSYSHFSALSCCEGRKNPVSGSCVLLPPQTLGEDPSCLPRLPARLGYRGPLSRLCLPPGRGVFTCCPPCLALWVSRFSDKGTRAPAIGFRPPLLR